MDMERRSQRYPSHRPLQLRCETWTEFVEAYASDVCRGGMFIRTDEAPEALSTLEVKLHLPQGTVVSLRARVVHVVTPEQAELHGRPAGIGVEFVHVDAEQKRQVMQLVEFARSQGGDDADPDANFSRSLFETSASMPARDVAARLSLLPHAANDGEASPPAAPRAVKQSHVNLPAVRLELDASEPANTPLTTTHALRPPPRPASAPLDPARSYAPENQPLVPTSTGPLSPGTRRSSAQIPIVRAPTGPLGRPTARSSTNTPIVRTPTGPLTGAGARTPIVRSPTGPLSGTPATGKPAPGSGQPRRATTGPLAPPETLNGNPEAPVSTPALTASGQPQPAPNPTDLNRLKLVLNALAHKHLEDAARMAREMLAENPGDLQVLKWQAICFARIALGRNDLAAAGLEYAKALRLDESNREAREFVRAFQRDRKLNSLPFGRYFLKKK